MDKERIEKDLQALYNEKTKIEDETRNIQIAMGEMNKRLLELNNLFRENKGKIEYVQTLLEPEVKAESSGNNQSQTE